MTIQYDDAGFIVGINKMREGIDRIHDETQEIIQVLKSQMQIANTRMAKLTRTLENRLIQSNNQQAANNRAERQRQSAGNNNPRPPSNVPLNRNPQPPSRISAGSVSARERAEQRERLQRDSQGGENSVDLADTGTDSQMPRRRERDSNGRFTSGSSDADNRLASKLNESIKNLGQTGVNAGGVDPVLDSLNEAKTLLSPLGRGAKLIGRGAKFSVSKFRSMKRREPLPQDQDRHNRENEKLLDKIWKAILKSNRSSGGFGGGLFGGLGGRDRNRRRRGRGRGGWRGTLGRLGELGGRGLGALGSIKGLGALAALAGAGSLAMNWSDLSKQEKTEQVGSVAGGGAGAVIGGVVGSLGGPIGTIAGATIGGWIGSKGGEVLATTVSPYISRWTTNLNRADLPKKMLNSFTEGLKPLFSGAGTIWDWVKNKVRGMLGMSTDDPNADPDVSAGVSQKANKAADIITRNALTKSAGYCARFVRQGLQQAGYDIKAQPTAKDYNKGALTDAGFSAIDKNSTPQKGDIMVFDAQGKHSAGHIQMYNGTQWVSDFKQNSDMPWGDVKKENAKYTMYRDLKGERVPGSAGSATSAASVAGKAAAGAQGAVDFFMGRGYTRAQAIGIAANIQQESQFNHKAYNSAGGGNGAKGLAQWRGSRQASFKKRYGKDILQATKEEQYDFIDYEMKTTHKSAYNKLKQANTIEAATMAVLSEYEKPGNIPAEYQKRMVNARAINQKVSTANPTVAAKAAQATPPKTTAPKGNNIKAASSFMPASQNFGATPSRLPIVPNIVIPSMPKITERLDSGGSNKPIVLQASSDTISQNVSDRGLAHAITGGLGQDRWG